MSLGAICAPKNKQSIYVYGVDFTQVKIHGATETIDQFTTIFEGINMLLVNETKKYDFSKMLRQPTQTDVEPTKSLIAAADFSNAISSSSILPEVDAAQMVKGYKLNETEGTGFVMIAQMLNKAKNEATYQLVVFDIATREIIRQKQVTGEAKGFGLRNFWAGSVYYVLKNTRFDK